MTTKQKLLHAMMVARKESIEELTGNDLFKEFGYDYALDVARTYEDGLISISQYEEYTDLFEQVNLSTHLSTHRT